MGNFFIGVCDVWVRPLSLNELSVFPAVSDPNAITTSVRYLFLFVTREYSSSLLLSDQNYLITLVKINKHITAHIDKIQTDIAIVYSSR